MSIPLDKIINYKDNVYELTSVAILDAQRLANRIARKKESIDDKVVSKALTKTLNDEVEYTRQED